MAQILPERFRDFYQVSVLTSRIIITQIPPRFKGKLPDFEIFPQTAEKECFRAGAAHTIKVCCKNWKGANVMEYDIDDLIFGDADPGPSGR